MDNLKLFTQALMLNEPWKVVNVEFTDLNKPELHITIDFIKGAKFDCPLEECTNDCLAVHDTLAKTWRHLNFFQYKTFIHARVPRVNCNEHGVHLVSVPWARPGSGFTLLVEAYVVEMSKHLTVAVLAKMMEEHDTRLWRIIHHYVEKARAIDRFDDVTCIGIDETSIKGHHYISVVVDLSKKRVLYCVEGKDSSTITSFVDDFKTHQGACENIKVITCDMSLGFKKGICEHFEKASMVIDKFHIIKHANEAVDKVRKAEAKTNTELKKSKYLWLKNPKNLTEKQESRLNAINKKNLKTARAYQMRLQLQEIYEECRTVEEAQEAMNKLISWMMHSRLDEMKKFARTLKNHMDDILNYFTHRYTNAILEGMNSIIQNIKCRSRGFRNIEYFKTMIYLVCGKLTFDFHPTL